MTEGPDSAPPPPVAPPPPPVDAPPPTVAQRQDLSSLTHDLRSALNPIVLWAHLALDPSISEEERLRRIRIIEGAAKRMAALIETIPSAPSPPASGPTTID